MTGPTGLYCGACNRHLCNQPHVEEKVLRERRDDGSIRRVMLLALTAHCSSCGDRQRIERRVAMPVVRP